MKCTFLFSVPVSRSVPLSLSPCPCLFHSFSVSFLESLSLSQFPCLLHSFSISFSVTLSSSASLSFTVPVLVPEAACLVTRVHVRVLLCVGVCARVCICPRVGSHLSMLCMCVCMCVWRGKERETMSARSRARECVCKYVCVCVCTNGWLDACMHAPVHTCTYASSPY